MFYRAKGGNVKIGNTDIDYVSFGKGEKSLIIIPGLADGLNTVKGKAIVLAMMYKMFANDYKTYIFSRKNQLVGGCSTRNMAMDHKIAMDKLGIEKAHVLGISQGGMICQYLAIDYPDIVDKLIIGVSVSRQNKTIQDVISSWIAMAENNDYKGLFIDSTEKTYSENKAKKYRPFYPILTKIGKPKSFNRFIIQARACLEHNAYEELNKIKSPTLILGGDSDLVVGKNTSEEMAEKIVHSKLIIYKGLGHGAFDEAKDFNQQVLNFLKS
ncbi:alpha/beta fold hydrolase [Alkaliphilus peptidifermentans]|uniref:Pimeloyl-ACP methyl ester carboxylesterase n=1 Tax=Alkaliphilus peptidifermentans DSM 18978 TaxID=1120976 RepID=A0A1G5L3I5_9FIRM|nr:alpha/beta hydrolase [Alkaliphilus peptidifermentans]SCZ07465.1 Pimeloyl-ACP methyl ester carboxylesterase [Alkaliphilus peptidifermentans DSM 18978]